MVCNYGQLPHDMRRVELQFLDASGKQLKNFTQDQRNPDWNQQAIIATIPTGAASARVGLRAIWYVSGDVDAYYDDTSVVVTSEKYNMVYVTEKTDRETAVAGDVLTLTYEKPAVFADDANISFWAKDRVYFMAANEIIKGVGNNKFAPKNVTSAEETNGYANATREQALIITVRMVQNLG